MNAKRAKTSGLLLVMAAVILTAGCGVADAGGRVASLVARAAQRCALHLAASYSGSETGAIPARPAPLAVAEAETVAPASAVPVREARNDAPRAAAAIEPVPISRDLSSIRPACGGTRTLLVRAEPLPRSAAPSIVVVQVRTDGKGLRAIRNG